MLLCYSGINQYGDQRNNQGFLKNNVGSETKFIPVRNGKNLFENLIIILMQLFNYESLSSLLFRDGGVYFSW